MLSSAFTRWMAAVSTLATAWRKCTSSWAKLRCVRLNAAAGTRVWPAELRAGDEFSAIAGQSQQGTAIDAQHRADHLHRLVHELAQCRAGKRALAELRDSFLGPGMILDDS